MQLCMPFFEKLSILADVADKHFVMAKRDYNHYILGALGKEIDGAVSVEHRSFV